MLRTGKFTETGLSSKFSKRSKSPPKCFRVALRVNIRGSSKLLLQLLVYARVVLIVARYTFQCKGFGSNPDSCSNICESSDNWMYHVGYPGRNYKFESYLLLFLCSSDLMVMIRPCQGCREGSIPFYCFYSSVV